MLIDQGKCIGCEECHPYCPVGAIKLLNTLNRPRFCFFVYCWELHHSHRGPRKEG